MLSANITFPNISSLCNVGITCVLVSSTVFHNAPKLFVHLCWLVHRVLCVTGGGWPGSASHIFPSE
ncbi:hypothetical protein EW026_g7685 [Hermanssonia centrifuga]|uniref:Uncharacterized protein n=1 Tax=Hermanssonia centrifuga TaxID=98765 RepID=A0A4S4K6Z3_9APHY|nr:hypothetical protein EW026_g7685 [Hermanssonia centrifuga]